MSLTTFERAICDKVRGEEQSKTKKAQNLSILGLQFYHAVATGLRTGLKWDKPGLNTAQPGQNRARSGYKYDCSIRAFEF